MRGDRINVGRRIALGLVTPVVATLIGVSTLGAMVPAAKKAPASAIGNLPSLKFRAVADGGVLRIAEFESEYDLECNDWMVALDLAPAACRTDFWRREQHSFAVLQSGLKLPTAYCANARVRAKLVHTRSGEALTEWSDVSVVAVK